MQIDRLKKRSSVASEILVDIVVDIVKKLADFSWITEIN
jgi:hypothetical protein